MPKRTTKTRKKIYYATVSRKVGNKTSSTRYGFTKKSSRTKFVGQVKRRNALFAKKLKR